MNACLQKYLSIYQKFPLGSYFTKEQRMARHKMITEWENEASQGFPSLDELIHFVKQYKDEIQITPQFFKKFKTIWQEDIENGYQFADFLLEMDLDELFEFSFNVSLMHLAEQILKYNPNHIKALTLKLKILVRYHDFCLHEMPWTILVEDNLDDELKSVQIMEDIVEKLNFKKEGVELLISNCRTYYPLWFEYLKEKEKLGFENFLISKGIDTDRINVPYVAI